MSYCIELFLFGFQSLSRGDIDVGLFQGIIVLLQCEFNVALSDVLITGGLKCCADLPV